MDGVKDFHVTTILNHHPCARHWACKEQQSPFSSDQGIDKDSQVEMEAPHAGSTHMMSSERKTRNTNGTTGIQQGSRRRCGRPVIIPAGCTMTEGEIVSWSSKKIKETMERSNLSKDKKDQVWDIRKRRNNMV